MPELKLGYTTVEADSGSSAGRASWLWRGDPVGEGMKTFVEQLFHSVVKQPIRAYGPGMHERLRQSFVASGFNIQKLLVDIATVSAMHGVEKNESKETNS